MSDLHRNPRHKKLKERTIALIKKSPSLKMMWSRIEKQCIKAPRDTQKAALMKWVWKGSFSLAYIRTYKVFGYSDARHITAWLVEELNEGL